MSARKVVVEITGDNKGYSKATDEAVRTTNTFADKMKNAAGEAKKGFLQGIGIGGGLTVFDMVAKSIGAVTDALGDSVTAAREELLSMSKLNAALEANVASWDGNTKAIEDTLRARMALGFADDEQRDSLAQLVAITKDSTAALDLQRQAMDLARLRGMSLADASMLLGKVYGGNVGILSRYGIQLDKGASATQALAEIQQRAAGQAEAWARENRKAVADVRIGDAMETLGMALIPVVDRMSELAADVLPGVIDGALKVADAIAPLVDVALKGISDAIKTIGDSFTALKELMDPTGTEADRLTRAIMKQAEALGLNGDEVIAHTERLKAQAKAERDRLAVAKQIADLDATIAGYTENARAEIDEYVKAIEDGADAEQFNNIIMERKLQLNAQLAPYLNERNRLLGIQQNIQNDANKVDNEGLRIQGLATQAIADYNKMLAESAQYQSALNQLLPFVTTGVEDQTAAVTESAGSYKKVSRAVKNTIDSMFMSISEAKGPWKEQWQQLAAWAKDPFTPQKFEDWIDERVRKAMKKARETFGGERRRWERIADAYRWIAKNNWIDPMKADIEKIMFALGVASRIIDAAKGGRKVGTNKGDIGRNAGGTDNWRGGLTWVGEKGPELLDVPSGSRILSNTESMRVAGGGGATTVNVVVNVPPTADLASVGREVVKAIRAHSRIDGGVGIRAAMSATG